MAGVKISDLSTVTPASTDLVVLDRPTTPLTGKATLASLAAAIGGVTSGTFNEPSPAEFVTTASLSIAGAQGLVYTAGQVGADTYFFVSGAIGGKGEATPGVTVFGGDLVISGNVEIGTLDSALGTDVSFFVSGVIGGKNGAIPGVGVFGGDVVISGTLHGGSPLNIGGEVQQGSRTFATDKYSVITGVNTGTDQITVLDASIFETGDTVAYVYQAAGNNNLLHTTTVVGVNTSTNVVSVANAVSITGGAWHILSEVVSGGDTVLFNLTKASSANFSFAAGSYTIAAGINSFSQGRKTAAIAPHSHAEGVMNLAFGTGSHAEGSYSKAFGDVSHAEGYGTESGYLGYALYDFGTGYLVADGGNWAFRLDPTYGDITSTVGNDLSDGSSNFITSEDVGGVKLTYSYLGASFDGTYTWVTGSGPTPASLYSPYYITRGFDRSTGDSIPRYTTYQIGGYASHSEGTETIAMGDYSHAEGYLARAFGNTSHAEGEETTTIRAGSHAEGQYTVAYGYYSHAEGQGTIASGSYQHAQGRYNLRNNDFSIFVIGNGTGDLDVDRSDVVRVDPGTPGTGSLQVTGTIHSTLGFSGSLTRLTDGRSYLVAGANVTIASASNGQVTISAAGGGGGGGSGDVYWSSTQDRAIFTTGSALFKGPGTGGTLGSADAPSDLGNDIFFFVSGTKASKETAVTGTAVFGGDVVISGSYYLGSDNSSITPLDFSVPLTQVGLLSTNRSSLKRSQYSTIQSSNGVRHEATSYSSIRSSYYPSPSFYGLYWTNYCTLDSSNSGFASFSDYSSMIASNAPVIGGSSYSFVAASSNGGGTSINGSSYSTTIATSNSGLAIQGFSRSAIIGGNNNLLNAGTGFPSLNSSVILGGKNWTIQESDTIAMGAASGGSTRLLVSASAGMYLGGDLQVTGNLSTTGNVTVSQLISVGQNLQVVGLIGVTGSAEFLGGVTGSLYYSASNAVHWNGSAPVTVAAALDRIAAFINSNIGPIT